MKKEINCPKCGEVLNVGSLLAQRKWQKAKEDPEAAERYAKQLEEARSVDRHPWKNTPTMSKGNKPEADGSI